MSVSGHDIVLLSTADWDNPFWTNKQHVAMELSRLGHKVLYIESLGLRAPTINKSDISRLFNRLLKGLRFPRKVNEGLWVWSPIVIPLQKYRLVRVINKWMLFVLAKGIALMLGFRRPVLWTYNPMTLELLKTGAGTKIVYHCVDEIKAQPGMPVKQIEQAEDRLLKRANYVFVTSEKLYQTRKQINGNTYLLPNVADYDHFSKARNGDLALPGDMAPIKKPIIGFVGALSPYKVDFDLLKFMAGARPDWSIVLIGKVGEGEPGADSSRLDAENIHLLGPKPYQDLPAYIQCFDVAIIPVTVNEYTNAMFPMKFFEYLAAGKRVVSTNIDSLRGYSQHALLSEGYEEFVTNIKNVLQEGNDVGLSERLALAKENTYRRRTEKMLAIINGDVGES